MPVFAGMRLPGLDSAIYSRRRFESRRARFHRLNLSRGNCRKGGVDTIHEQIFAQVFERLLCFGALSGRNTIVRPPKSPADAVQPGKPRARSRLIHLNLLSYSGSGRADGYSERGRGASVRAPIAAFFFNHSRR